MKIRKFCLLTTTYETEDIPITPQQYQDWLQGKTGVVQRAFPHLNADQREFLITGCPFSGDKAGTWDRLLGTPEIDEERNNLTVFPEDTPEK